LFEAKLNGVRCLALRSGEDIQLISRNEKPMNDKYPELVKAFHVQAPKSFAVDGEIVTFDGEIWPTPWKKTGTIQGWNFPKSA
jgi:bifunctional non-homologous end joining protein LigD